MTAKLRILLIITLLFSTTFYTNQVFANSTDMPTPTLVEQEPLRFIIYYNGDISTMMNDNDSYLKTFMAVYNLELVNTFELNEFNKGFTLEAKTGMKSSNDVAKELSLINNVLMIEVVEPRSSSEI